MSLATRLQALQPKPPRILVIDIETAPARAFVWGLRDQQISPSQVIEQPRVLCFAAKWHNEKRVQFHSEREGREPMIEAAWRYLNEADIVTGYNHVRFDVPHLQREMVQLGWGPPSPWIDVDLLTVVRRRFRFLSNKLGSILEQLDLNRKGDPGGFDTWRAVLEGDEAGWKRMEKYNRQDVQITADLFQYLLPWLNLPHAGLFTGNLTACPSCGCTSIEPDGIDRTRASAWIRLVCVDCHAYMRLMDNGQTRRI